MKIRYLIVLLLNLLFYQCGINDEKRRFIFKTDDKGELEKFEYIIRNNDTIIDGTYEKRYSNGKLKVKGEFKNNQLQGFVNYFNKNGDKEIFSVMDSGKLIASSLFDKNGNINNHLLYDYENNLRFNISYLNKTVVKYDGVPIFRALKNKEDLNYFNSKFKVDDILIYKIIVANIPYTKRSIKVKSNKKSSEIYLVFQNDSTLITVEDANHEKGLYSINYEVEYKFNDNITPALKDTLVVKYEVK